MTSEAYQRLAARYFSYGSRGRWLWMLLQYRQIKAVSDEAGLALLRIWLADDVLICVSMLGMYLPAELILG